MKIRAHAKINLTLDIVGRDASSGYHFIESIMTVVSDVFDDISIEPRDDNEIIITCDHPDVPVNEQNLCYQAVRLLTDRGFDIHITKRIPIGGGFGGGSSNAAAVLKAVNELADVQKSVNELQDISAQIGMDVPFFIEGKTVRVFHFGEKIEQLKELNDYLQKYSFEIIDTGIHVETEWAYEQMSKRTNEQGANSTRRLLDVFRSGEDFEIAEYIHNDFAEIVFAKHPQLRSCGFLSGSGGGCFKVKNF